MAFNEGTTRLTSSSGRPSETRTAGFVFMIPSVGTLRGSQISPHEECVRKINRLNDAVISIRNSGSKQHVYCEKSGRNVAIKPGLA